MKQIFYNGKGDDVEKLIELHDNIKNHPYRINGEERFLGVYKKLLYDLSREFYITLGTSEYKNARNMIHDFNGSISNVGRTDFDFSMSVAHVERCIGVIHMFIETGEVKSYWTYYTGANHYGLPEVKKYVWDEQLKRYFLHCSEEEFDKSIKYLKLRVPFEKDSAWKVYEPELNWVEEQKEYWKDKRTIS